MSCLQSRRAARSGLTANPDRVELSRRLAQLYCSSMSYRTDRHKYLGASDGGPWYSLATEGHEGKNKLVSKPVRSPARSPAQPARRARSWLLCLLGEEAVASSRPGAQVTCGLAFGSCGGPLAEPHSASQWPSFGQRCAKGGQRGKRVGKIPEIFDVKRAGMPPWPSSRDAAALPAHPYEIEFARKEFLEQATRRLSLDRRSAPTDTDVDILIPRPGPAWAGPCSAVAVDQGSHRPSPCLAGKSAGGERRVLAR